MKKWWVWMILLFLLGCAEKMPPRPHFDTASGQDCAAACEKDYSECIDSNIRPDYLVMSPRKKACARYIRDCYQLCEKKEKQ
jgi:hypothetical protein